MRQYTIFLENDVFDEIKRIAKEKKVKPAVIIRWAMDEYLKNIFLPNRSIDSTIVLEVQPDPTAAVAN